MVKSFIVTALCQKCLGCVYIGLILVCFRMDRSPVSRSVYDDFSDGFRCDMHLLAFGGVEFQHFFFVLIPGTVDVGDGLGYASSRL